MRIGMMMNGKKTGESAVFIAMMKPGWKASEKLDSVVSGTVVVLCNGGSIFARFLEERVKVRAASLNHESGRIRQSGC